MVRVVLAIGVVAATVLVPAAPAAASAGVQLTAAEQAHLDLLNDYRRGRGLPEVQVDAGAQRDARRWTAHLATQGTPMHSSTLLEDCQRAGECAAAAENIGYAGSHEEVFARFEGSDGHARNMNMAAVDGVPVVVGLGVFEVGDGVYVTQRLYRCRCENDALAQQLNDSWAGHVAYAEALHHDLLDRSASPAAVDAVAAPLAYGASRGHVAQSLVYSDAWVGAVVGSYYQATLGRDPDPDGLAHWIGMITGGASTADVAAHFFGSREYVERTGGTFRSWVDDLYRRLHGRPATGAEVDHWTGVIRSGTPAAEVAGAVYLAEDARRRRVRALYQQLLGRDPDAAGWAHWTAQLADGRDVRLALELVTSGEYAARAVDRFR